MLSLIIAFLIYSMNLTANSNNHTPRFREAAWPVRLGHHAAVHLSFVCFLNAFPYRKR